MKRKLSNQLAGCRYFFYAVNCLLFILTSAGCKDKTSEKKYVIGFSQCIGSDVWRKTMLDEMKMELSLNPSAEFIYADAGGNNDLQIKQVQDMVSKGIDLLIISPNEAQPLTRIVEETFAKGIPVIVIDRKTSSSLYTAYVGADNYEIGKMAGDYLGVTLKNGGKVLEVMGLSGSSPAIERQHGFFDAIKKYQNITIQKQVYGNWLKNSTKKTLSAESKNLFDIDAIFAHNDQMALGAWEVLRDLNLENRIKIIGVDAIPGEGGGLEMVYYKTIDASFVYPTGGKEAIQTAFAILNKEFFLKENILPTVAIDSSNVQLMKMQWTKIKKQQNDIEKQQSLLVEQQRVYNNQRVILNIIVITLVLAVFFGGLAFYSLSENRKITKSLEQKNIEIQDQRNQLIEMSAKVQVATEAKLNFFTNISHEFRTPLTLIISPIEDMLKDNKLTTMMQFNLKLMHKNVLRLLLLVDQLIDYRKIEFNKMQMKASCNNLVAFTRDILDLFQDAASRKNISLRLVSEEKDLPIWFDVNMLDKVIFNILSNAFKFTGVNGEITVSIFRSLPEQKAFIKIADNGIGMSEDIMHRVFELFYQGEQFPTKGSGIGLSLAKELMELHHGSVTVKSNPKEGTIFTLTLPLEPDQLKEHEMISKQPLREIMEDVRLYQTGFDDAEVEQPNEMLVGIKEHSILIIEDDEDMLNYLSQKLSDKYEVVSANNGRLGLDEAFTKVPDLIISDVAIPEISGHELTARLKSDVRTSHIPIILLTAQSSIKQQIEGIKCMSDAYIVKPFNLSFLIENIENLIKNRLLLRDHYVSELPVNSKLPMSGKLDKKFINDFAGIVENNLSNEKFNVDMICKNMGVSRVQLYRKTKALLGCSISDYIVNRRLQKAKYLLLNTDLTISEITYQVGFSSHTYFSTVFKSQFDISPSDFKKEKNKEGLFLTELIVGNLKLI